MTKAIIDVLVDTDVYETSRLLGPLGRILSSVRDEEAEVLPRAFASAIRAVESDLPRVRAAAEVAVQLDLHEAVDALLECLNRASDPRLTSAVATLLSSPAIPEDERARAIQKLSMYRRASEPVERLISVRLSDLAPETDAERLVQAQVWPGSAPVSLLSRLAPLAFVSEHDAPRADFWRTVGAIALSGARVRRVPQATRLIFRNWAHQDAPLVAWSGTAIAAWKNATGYEHVRAVMVGDLSNNLSLPRLVNQVQLAMPNGWVMRELTDSVSIPNEMTAFSVEALREGGFDNAEMQYLGAASRSVLASLAKDVIRPRDFDRHRWTFDQLVTLRLVQGFKVLRKGRTDAKRLYERLNDLTLAASTSEVAYDASGELYVDTGDGYRTLEGNQAALADVLRVDAAFRPFRLGNGLVPDLLQPSPRTRVDPRILGGTPVVRDWRLSARAVWEVYSLRGEDAARSAYPELNGAEISDAVRVGNAIEVVR